jgi:hypothetical protein
LAANVRHDSRDDGLGLFEGASRHARGLGGLVGGVPFRSFWQLTRPFAAETSALTLTLLCRRSLDWLERALDGDGLRQREIFAEGVLGVLAAHDRVEIHDGNRDLGPAEQLGGAQPELAGDKRAVGLYDNRVKQADVVDVGGERGDVAHFAAVPLADDDFIDATHRHGTAPIVANRERTCRIVRALTVPAFVPSWTATPAFFACLALRSLTEKAIFSKGFCVWRRGRVAEGGGLLNRYTV